MKYYEKLLQMEVFNFEDVQGLTGSLDSAKNLLDRYVQKGLLKKIKWNFYYCVNLENRNSAANRFVIGSNINQTSYVSYHSAFDYYGLANQPFYEISIGSDKAFRNFDFEGITYKYVKAHFNEGVVVPETNHKIRVTDLERTVVDCIKSVDLSGGIEELFQCLDAVSVLDNDKLFKYLNLYDIQFLFQKAGYMFEKYQKDFCIKDELISACSNKVSNSIRYLDEDAKNGKGTLIKKWNLIVPKSQTIKYNEGMNEFV